MYCKKCGVEIPENSAFCLYCGEKLNVNINEKKQNKTLKIIAITLILSVLLFFIAAVLDPLLFPYGIKRGLVRKANDEDIEIDYEPDLSSLTFDLVITPNKDIKELEIYIFFEDQNGQRFYTEIETVSSVKAGTQVREQFKIAEKSVLKILEGGKITVKVKNGYVPYLQ